VLRCLTWANAIAGRFDLNAAASDSWSATNGCCPPTFALGTLAGDPVTTATPPSSPCRWRSSAALSDTATHCCPPARHAVKYSGPSFAGVKTNYDFCAYEGTYVCNAWKTQAPTARRMFGENATTRRVMITDWHQQQPSPWRRPPTTCNNGTCAAWGYRGWVQVGHRPGQGINRWDYGIAGSCRSTAASAAGRMGSMHSGGANCVFADGSVRFLSETADVTLLTRLSAMADGNPTGDIRKRRREEWTWASGAASARRSSDQHRRADAAPLRPCFLNV